MSAAQQWDYSFDVVVVGSGNGGLTAALCAYEMGTKDVQVIEKSDSEVVGRFGKGGPVRRYQLYFRWRRVDSLQPLCQRGGGR